MELPLYSPGTTYLEKHVRFDEEDTARVRHRTALSGTHRWCFCWSSRISAQKLAIAPTRSPLICKVIDFSVVLKASSAPPPSHSSSLRYQGKRRDFHAFSSRGPPDSNTAKRNKDAAFVLVNEQSSHRPSRKRVAELAGRKAFSSVPITNNSDSKDTPPGEPECKPSGKACPNTAISTESTSNSALKRESGGKLLSSKRCEAASVLDRHHSRNGAVNSALSKKFSSSSKDKALTSLVGEGEQRSSLRPVLSRAHSARASQKRRKYLVVSQTQAEEEKAKKLEKAKERLAMAEANGFRLSKRAKKNPEEIQYVLKLNLCSKHADLHGALDIYDMVRKGEIFNLKQHHYNVLLYICSGAASGSIAKSKSSKAVKSLTSTTNDLNKSLMKDMEESMAELSKGEGDSLPVDVVFFSQEDMQLAAQRGKEIYQDMLQAKVPPNEATFTSVARLAVAKGDGDMAFEIVKKMAAAGIIPKLRSYGPALLCFCETNEVLKAFEVDDHMTAAGVFPDENLLEALLKLSITAGLQDKVYSLLQRLRKTVRNVSPATVMTIEGWFNSEAAVSASISNIDYPPSTQDIRQVAESRGGGWHGLGWLGKGKWKTKRTSISQGGVCQSCGERLCTIDLDPEETENFARSVAELAMQREHNANEFVTFKEWLDKNGPFEAILDGANIGMFNSALRGFNFNQVATVVSAMKARSLIKNRLLIILHCRRTSDGVSRSPRSQSIIDNWNNENILYSTPHGSNDDWYWLYAAVKCKSLLVSNDEMRDHLFELLGNNFFPKWKERHQVRFNFSGDGLELLMPPPYSTVIQESLCGSWHIPQSGGDGLDSPQEWLCVTRSATDPNVDSSKSVIDRKFMSAAKEVAQKCPSQKSEEEQPSSPGVPFSKK